MKKLLILLCISSLLACTNSGTGKTESVQTTAEEHPQEPQTLGLNNGSKWKSDDVTNKNVTELETTVKQFTNNQPKTLADFSRVANELQTGLDKMISECRMHGAEHEALHQWLEPLIINVSQLKKASEEKEALKLLAEINEQLKNYHQYFD